MRPMRIRIFSTKETWIAATEQPEAVCRILCEEEEECLK
jgi:hypothetical protein